MRLSVEQKVEKALLLSWVVSTSTVRLPKPLEPFLPLLLTEVKGKHFFPSTFSRILCELASFNTDISKALVSSPVFYLICLRQKRPRVDLNFLTRLTFVELSQISL